MVYLGGDCRESDDWHYSGATRVAVSFAAIGVDERAESSIVERWKCCRGRL